MGLKKQSAITLTKIAAAAGVSKAAASFALQNRPGVSKATRKRILEIATQLGYVPDARLASVMATLRQAKAKDLLPIAWLNSHDEKDAWQNYKFLTPFLEGARARALESGYRLEEIWIHRPGTSFQQISQLLHRQGIEGVIITHPARHLRLRWDELASICLGGALLAPRLHRVQADHAFNLQLALKSLRRLGYRRIGICLGDDVDRLSGRTCSTTAYHFAANQPQRDRIPPLFYPWAGARETVIAEKQTQAWLRANKPDVVVGHNAHLVEWVRAAGFQLPQEIGVVHIATDDDVHDWAGICSNRREIGATAAEWVINQVRERRFGLPKISVDMMVRGSWHLGSTLRTPNWLEPV
jgi:DNA-binding LacI/PurR family transcriptional regulator